VERLHFDSRVRTVFDAGRELCQWGKWSRLLPDPDPRNQKGQKAQAALKPLLTFLIVSMARNYCKYLLSMPFFMSLGNGLLNNLANIDLTTSLAASVPICPYRCCINMSNSSGNTHKKVSSDIISYIHTE